MQDTSTHPLKGSWRFRAKKTGALAAVAMLSAGIFGYGFVACSSDSFTTTPSTDGGGVAEGSTSDAIAAGDSSDASDGASPTGCLVPPTATGTEKDFCDYFAAAYSRCGDCQPCRQDDVNDCVTLGNGLSEAYKAAVISCAAEETCAEIEKLDFGKNDCVVAALAAATPSAAQTAAKDAYCTDCSDGGTSPSDEACRHFFVAGDGGAGAGAGAYVMLLNDTAAAQVQAGCNACAPLSYGACAALKTCMYLPKSQCPTGLCK